MWSKYFLIKLVTIRHYFFHFLFCSNLSSIASWIELGRNSYQGNHHHLTHLGFCRWKTFRIKIFFFEAFAIKRDITEKHGITFSVFSGHKRAISIDEKTCPGIAMTSGKQQHQQRKEIEILVFRTGERKSFFMLQLSPFTQFSIWKPLS